MSMRHNSDFLVTVNRKSLQIKYSIKLADVYRTQLRKVKTFEDLDSLISGIDLENGFLAFAKENGVVPKAGEWDRSKEFIITQLKGLFGRYSVLDDKAFYPYVLRIDNVVQSILNMGNN